MSVEFRLPDVGEGLEEAEVVRWLVKVGEPVERDQPIVEIQTDKALVEIPSPWRGRMEELAAEEGQIVKVGDLLFVVDDGDSGETPEPPARPAPGTCEHRQEGVQARPCDSEQGSPDFALSGRREDRLRREVEPLGGR